MCYEMISVKSLQKIIKIIWENDEDKLKIQEEKFNQYSLKNSSIMFVKYISFNKKQKNNSEKTNKRIPMYS